MKKTLLFLFGSCVLVLVGEIFARTILGLGDPPLSIEHSKIEYMYAPNQSVSRFSNNFSINSYGMRSAEFKKQKSNNEVRVMVFGDSVLNGGNLTDDKDLATSILSDNMSTSTGKQVTVGNISAGSWGPGNWLAYAEEYGFFDADIVVLVMSSHDIADNPTFVALNPNTHPTQKPYIALIEGFTRYLPRYFPKFSTKNEIEKTPIKKLSEEYKHNKAKEQGLMDLRKFMILAQKSAETLVVVHWMEKAELDTGKPQEGFTDIKRLTNELGITLRSSAPSLLEAIDNGVMPYRDNIHPNETGQKIIEKIIFQEVEMVTGNTNVQ